MSGTHKTQVAFRLLPSEKEKIEKSAAELHMTVTDYIRACCLRKRVMDTSWVPEITKQITSVRNNLCKFINGTCNVGCIAFHRVGSTITVMCSVANQFQ